MHHTYALFKEYDVFCLHTKTIILGIFLLCINYFKNLSTFPFGGKILAIYFDLFSICQNHFAHLLLTLSFQCPVLHCAIGKS